MLTVYCCSVQRELKSTVLKVDIVYERGTAMPSPPWSRLHDCCFGHNEQLMTHDMRRNWEFPTNTLG